MQVSDDMNNVVLQTIHARKSSGICSYSTRADLQINWHFSRKFFIKFQIVETRASFAIYVISAEPSEILGYAM